MRRAYLFILSWLLVIPLFFLGCSAAPDFWAEAKSGQKRVLVSFPPLYAMTHAVAGDDAKVMCLLTQQGPHDYEGSATDLLRVRHADLFIYNGLTLDDVFVDKMLQNHRNSSLVAFNLGGYMEKKHHDLMLHMEHDHDHGHGKDKDGHQHKHGEHDPHMWLGPPQAMKMTEVIATKLAELDPARKKGFQERATKFVKQIQEVETYGKDTFKKNKSKKIVTMHDSFGYFAEAFDIKIVATIQPKPGVDPDAVTIAKLIEACQKEQVSVITVEPQYPKGHAEAIQSALKAKKLDVRIVTLDPLETAPVAQGQTFNPDPGYYLKKMRENIDELSKALP